MSKLSIRGSALASIALGLAFSASTYAGTTVVSPSNMNGWSFLTTDNNGDPAPGNGNIAGMVTGPSTPPGGIGSANLATASGQGDSSAQILTSAYNGVALSSLTSLGYSTYDTANNGQQFPYLKLSLDNGDALFFEPPYQTPGAGNPSLPDQGATQLNKWQSWNALSGGWWDNDGNFNPGAGPNGVDSIADYLAIPTNTTVKITGISLRVGYASPGDNFNGYVDDFVIGTGTAPATTYDFEPDATTSVPDSANTLMLGFTAIVALGTFSTMAKKKAVV